jgi:hypothetical protein
MPPKLPGWRVVGMPDWFVCSRSRAPLIERTGLSKPPVAALIVERRVGDGVQAATAISAQAAPRPIAARRLRLTPETLPATGA